MLILRNHKWPAGHKNIQVGVKFKGLSALEDALLFLFLVPRDNPFWSINTLLKISGALSLCRRSLWITKWFKFKHAVQRHMMSSTPPHTYPAYSMPFHLLFNFPSQRPHLPCLKCGGKQEPGSSICLLTLRAALQFTVHVSHSDTPR